MNSSRSHLAVICLFIIAFLSLQTGCSSDGILYVHLCNCSDDNIRIERGMTNLHIPPNPVCDLDTMVYIGFIDLNKLDKHYSVRRKTGLSRTLSIMVDAEELRDSEDPNEPNPKAVPITIQLKITEDDLRWSASEPIYLQPVYIPQRLDTFVAILHPLLPKADENG